MAAITRRRVWFSGLLLLSANVVCLAQTPRKYELQKDRTFSEYFRGAFSPDGERLALIDPRVLSVFNTKTGKRICSFKAPGPDEAQPSFLSVVFVPDTKLIAANFTDFQPETSSVTQRIILLESSTCRENSRLVSKTQKDIGVYITTSSDGSLIATSADVGRIWARDTGKEIYLDIPPEKYALKESVISPDGNYFVSYLQSTIPPYHDFKVLLRDLRTRARREISTYRTWGMLFSPDSRVLTLVGHTGEIGTGATVSQFSLPDGEKMREFVSSDVGFFPDISPDGLLLASGDTDGVFRVIRMSDGQLVASARHYKRTLLDDLQDRMHMITQIELVKFSPDGRSILTGGEDGSVKLWRLKGD